ncbi:MAG: SPOR domain-containing protein [Sulfitobacter sp.]
MADYNQSPYGGVAPHVQSEYAVAPSNPLSKATNIAGAAISLALVVGVGVWGYKLLVRDVSGIPVVRAAAGEMRVRPEEPGGQLAQHQGLSVNNVAEVGAAEAHADQLKLAPKPIELAEEDEPILIPQDVAATPGTPAPSPEQVHEAAMVQDVAKAFEDGSVEDLVAQLTNGVAPLEPLEGETVPVKASISGAELGGAGIRVSLRPTLRPSRAARPTQVAATAPAASSSPKEIPASSLPVGTRLVQLGAFDSPEIARAQWGQLSARFAPFMDGKDRVVMEAKSGGRTFYRLRAHGFDDIGEARRFCSALLAESVDCIPVVTR